MNSKLILGTVQLGLDYGINNDAGKPTIDKAFKILNIAYENGISILDTAEAYGNSQEVIGRFQKEHPEKKFKIITKLAANHDLSQRGVTKSIERDITILNAQKLYGFMFHNYESFKINSSYYDEIIYAKELGLIEKSGISLYTNDQIEDIVSNFSDFDFIQIPFNILDNASKREAIIKKAKEKNIEIHTRSVFLQGLFFKKANELPLKLKPLVSYLKNVNDIRQKYKLDTANLALHYALQKNYIDYVLVGVENEMQLMENIAICNKEITVPHNKLDAIDVKEEYLLNPSNWN